MRNPLKRRTVDQIVAPIANIVRNLQLHAAENDQRAESHHDSAARLLTLAEQAQQERDKAASAALKIASLIQ